MALVDCHFWNSITRFLANTCIPTAAKCDPLGPVKGLPPLGIPGIWIVSTRTYSIMSHPWPTISLSPPATLANCGLTLANCILTLATCGFSLARVNSRTHPETPRSDYCEEKREQNLHLGP